MGGCLLHFVLCLRGNQLQARLVQTKGQLLRHLSQAAAALFEQTMASAAWRVTGWRGVRWGLVGFTWWPPLPAPRYLRAGPAGNL